MKKLWIAALLAALAGCGGKHSAEYREMQAMAAKIRSFIEQSLAEMNINQTTWATNASCMFAREMDCVAGKSPDTSRGGKDVMRTEAPSEYEARIKGIILNPNGLVRGMSAKSYAEVLGWMLTEDELARLQAIRTKYKYWDQLKAALTRG